MQWPDHLLPTDERLHDALAASFEFHAEVTVTEVLRHVPGRRVTALATDGARTLVVKVFHSPRARGNHRRLSALAAAGLADIVPPSFGCDDTGHVGIVGHRPGIELQSVTHDEWVPSCRRAGVALRRLHESGADLDRQWTVADEVAQLRAMTPDHLLHQVEDAIEGASSLHGTPLVPSHRDCHPRQLVVDGGHVAWIDLDDCTMAPAALDVANMLAHLTREAIVGRRDADTVAAARLAFLDGYGGIDRSHCHAWELLSLARLAGLAETRHHAPDERDALLHHLEDTTRCNTC